MRTSVYVAPLALAAFKATSANCFLAATSAGVQGASNGTLRANKDDLGMSVAPKPKPAIERKSLLFKMKNL